MQTYELLDLMVDRKATQLYLIAPGPPLLRVGGIVVPQEDLPAITAEDLEIVLEDITTPEQRGILFRETELDLAMSVPGLAQFHVTVVYQKGKLSLAFGLVPLGVLSVDELKLLLNQTGLILVTGPSSSGESTVVAAMIVNLN